MMRSHKFAPLAAVLLLGACTTIPSGPSVMVLPGSGRTFDEFRADDFVCRQFASDQIGGTTANQAANDSGVATAAVGTVMGALIGAAINGRQGASVGAGAGLLMGSAEGANAARHTGYSTQRRYDNSYQQCMYSKGHKVPVAGRYSNESRPMEYSNIPPPNTPPPGATNY